MKIENWIEWKKRKRWVWLGRMMAAGQYDCEQEASLGFSKISVFVSMPLAELNYTLQPSWNSLSLTMVHCCTRLLALTSVWQGLCLRCRTGTSHAGSHGWALQWCPNPVLGRQWGVLSAPLPHCQQKKTWLHELLYMTLETSIWTAGQSVPQDTLESVSALIGTARFHWSGAFMIRVGTAEYDLSTICLWKCHSKISNKWCQALCMVYAPGFLQETSLT